MRASGPPSQVGFALVLLLWRELVLPGGEGSWVLSGVGTLFPAPSSPYRRSPSCVVPLRNQTYKSHRGAGGVQGPLSAAARIDPARPWVKYHFQSRPGMGSWRNSRVGGSGWLPSPEAGGACRVYSCPLEGYPLGSGPPEAAAGGPARPPELTAPPPLPGWFSLGVPGRVLKLRGDSRSEGPVGDAVWWVPLCRVVQGVVLLIGCLRGHKAP